MILPRKTILASSCATGSGTVNHGVLREVYRTDVSLEICRAAEGGLATRYHAEVPIAGSDREAK